VVGIAYDCKENQVYWTDLSARTINRASIAAGAEPETLVSTSKNTHTHTQRGRSSSVCVLTRVF